MDDVVGTSKASDTKPFFRTSAFGKATIEKALETGQIEVGQDVVKLAVALALAVDHRCQEDAKLSGNGMSWGISQFDSDGSLRRLVRSLYFEGAEASEYEIYTAAELLAEKGLEILADGLVEGRSIVQIATDYD